MSHPAVSHRIVWAFALFISFPALSHAASTWKAGVAKSAITPAKSIWLTGFASRTRPSDGKLHDLYVKALALEGPSGGRAVLVTSDLLGFPAEVADRICSEVAAKHAVPRERLMLNSSHTHGAPALDSPAHFIYGPRSTPEQQRDVAEYTRDLEAKVVATVAAAIAGLKPSHLEFGRGSTDFAVNRRLMTPKGLRSFTPDPNGPVDHSVPVLRVTGENGGLTAVVFGYAAHPTTITGGPLLYAFSGDYAGFAQQLVEESHPNTTALFVQGCGGDVMVSPRGSVEQARAYGRKLATAVEEVLAVPARPVAGPISAAFDTIPLPYSAPPTREQFEQELTKGDVDHRHHARQMLAKLDRDGALPTAYPRFPIQVWQLGPDFTLIALGGETTSTYGLRLRRDLGDPAPPPRWPTTSPTEPSPASRPATPSGPAVWVAGYSNDLCSYIPTKKIIEEGGYEGDRSQIYYMHPAPYAPTIEESIVTKARELVTRARKSP